MNQRIQPTSARAADEMSRKINRMNSLRASGDDLPIELVRYIETMPPKIRERLAAWDIISASRVTAGKPLSQHLEDWTASLLAKGNTERHAELVTSRARSAFDVCRFSFWSEISATKLETSLAELREDRTIDVKRPDGTTEKRTRRGISAQTFNFYLQAVKQFCRWMVQNGRASESPLVHLKGINVKTDRRHDRRALSADELI